MNYVPTSRLLGQCGEDIIAIKTTIETAVSVSSSPVTHAGTGFRYTVHDSTRKWLAALRAITPIFISTHLAFMLLSYFSSLFLINNFSPATVNLGALYLSWFRWDGAQFLHIAQYGYTGSYRTAFFPLYPILEGALAVVTRDPHIAGLLISNLAGLGLCTVFYRLICQDFGQEQALKAVLYLSIFPTAFFLAAGYNESLFIFLALLSFYAIRRGQWWLAGLAGLLAGLTRSAGLVLLVPFLYEYLRQRDFTLNSIRPDILAGLGIPAGVLAFSGFCYFRFHDLLAFSHAQALWGRHLAWPWTGPRGALSMIVHSPFLSFNSIHNVIDLSAAALIFLLLALCFTGPWKLSGEQRAYGLYGAAFYLFLLLFPAATAFPLVSISRFALELFPAFIILAAIGKNRQFNLYYTVIAASLLSFFLLQFLLGRWIV